MSATNEIEKCLICSKNYKIMIPLQECMMACYKLTVVQVLGKLNFLKISDPVDLCRRLCCTCVSKIQSCFEFKVLCTQIGIILKNAHTDTNYLTKPTLLPVEQIKQEEEWEQNVEEISTEDLIKDYNFENLDENQIHQNNKNAFLQTEDVSQMAIETNYSNIKVDIDIDDGIFRESTLLPAEQIKQEETREQSLEEICTKNLMVEHNVEKLNKDQIYHSTKNSNDENVLLQTENVSPMSTETNNSSIDVDIDVDIDEGIFKGLDKEDSTVNYGFEKSNEHKKSDEEEQDFEPDIDEILEGNICEDHSTDNYIFNDFKLDRNVTEIDIDDGIFKGKIYEINQVGSHDVERSNMSTIDKDKQNYMDKNDSNLSNAVNFSFEKSSNKDVIEIIDSETEETETTSLLSITDKIVHDHTYYQTNPPETPAAKSREMTRRLMLQRYGNSYRKKVTNKKNIEIKYFLPIKRNNAHSSPRSLSILKKINHKGVKRARNSTNKSSIVISSESEPDEQRNFHNDLERIRRETMQAGFIDLQKLVPYIANKPRVAKATILLASADYCYTIMRQEIQLMQQKEELRRKQTQLKSRIYRLRRQITMQR